MQELWPRFLASMEREGSTRAVGLLRILLVLIVWSRWANELLPFRDGSPERLLLSIAFFLVTPWMLVGFYGRAATAATALVIGVIVFWFGRVRGEEPWTHHHTTLLAYATAFLALTPNSTSFSLDRWLAVRRAERRGLPPPPEIGPLWAVNLLALQVSAVYFWSAFDKTTLGFLAGFRLEQIFLEIWWSSDWSPSGAVRALFGIAAIGVVILEYALAIGLWFPRTHRVLIPLGLLLHAVLYVAIPVGPFSVTMWALYLAFLDPEGVHRAIDRLLGRSAREGPGLASAPQSGEGTSTAPPVW